MAGKQAIITKRNGLILLAIPIVLSAFTHLYNAAGFPDIFYDEGVYMRRAMSVLHGLGPQEGSFHDHPYFGQLFLAGFFKITGYPDLLNPSATPQSVEALYLVPRLLMGVLAVVDTFLIFKISEKRYGWKVALFSSVLFAVMPITWMTRRILLDSILLPFLLGSVLFALYSADNAGKRKAMWIILSGAFLGIAIFTKIPVFTMMPLVGYLVYSGAGVHKTQKVKMLGLWLVPVLLIPMIWPAYNASLGQFDKWTKDVVWQTQRQALGLRYIAETFFSFDPILFLLGISGFIYAGIKKDFLVLLWIVSFVVFLSFLGYVQYFYWIPVLPVFCIAAGTLVERLASLCTIAPYVAIAGLGVFGLVATSLLIAANVTSSQFEAAAFVASKNYSDTTVVASPTYSWLFIHIFNIPHSFADYRDLLFSRVETKKMLLISDLHFQRNIDAGKQLRDAYEGTELIKTFKGNAPNYDSKVYPYTNMVVNHEGSNIEIRIRS